MSIEDAVGMEGAPEGAGEPAGEGTSESGADASAEGGAAGEGFGRSAFGGAEEDFLGIPEAGNGCITERRMGQRKQGGRAQAKARKREKKGKKEEKTAIRTRKSRVMINQGS
jgi:hypothetical protein